MPSLKISKEAFADSLKVYLKSKNVIIKYSLIPFRFFLTTHSQIHKLNALNKKPSPDHFILRDAILHFSDLWKPAVQNSRPDCAYVFIQMEFRDDKINVIINQ